MDSKPDDQREQQVIDYRSPSPPPAPEMTPYMLGSSIFVAVGLVAAAAGNEGKGWNGLALAGICCVIAGIATYFAGRSICRRPPRK